MISTAAKEARRAYKREWRKRNPELVKAAQDRYWERVAARNTEKPGQEEQSQAEGAAIPNAM